MCQLARASTGIIAIISVGLIKSNKHLNAGLKLHKGQPTQCEYDMLSASECSRADRTRTSRIGHVSASV